MSAAPASVRLPPAAAVNVNPSGRPATVIASAVSAAPSYTFSAEGAVKVIAVSFPVTVSVPICSVSV